MKKHLTILGLLAQRTSAVLAFLATVSLLGAIPAFADPQNGKNDGGKGKDTSDFDGGGKSLKVQSLDLTGFENFYDRLDRDRDRRNNRGNYGKGGDSDDRGFRRHRETGWDYRPGQGLRGGGRDGEAPDCMSQIQRGEDQVGKLAAASWFNKQNQGNNNRLGGQLGAQTGLGSQIGLSRPNTPAQRAPSESRAIQHDR